MAIQDYKYKVTYLSEYKAMAFVRIKDDALLYTNENEITSECMQKASATQRTRNSSSNN